MTKGLTTKFYGTTFQVVSGYAAGVALTGLSNGLPAVVTAVGHGLVDNDIVKIEAVVGLTDLNGKNYVVNVLTANTFELLGTNTSNADVYTSGGTFAKATLSATCQMTGSTHGSGSTTEITTETNCGISKDFGAPDDGQATFNFNYAPATVITALETSRTSVSEIAVMTTLPASAGIMVDIGVVTSVSRDGSAGGVWTGSATLTRTQARVDIAI